MFFFLIDKIPIQIFTVLTPILGFIGILCQVRYSLTSKNREKIVETSAGLVKVLISSVPEFRQKKPLTFEKDLNLYFQFLSKKAICLLTIIYKSSRKLETDEEWKRIYNDIAFLIYLLRMEVNFRSEIKLSYTEYGYLDVEDIIFYEEREKEREEFKKEKDIKKNNKAKE